MSNENKNKSYNKTKKSNLKFKKRKSLRTKHGKKWNYLTHWGQCGQSCPCCRWKIGREIIGSCVICKNES
jgi:hypothetical protein